MAAVAVGGALGALLRYTISTGLGWGLSGTLAANVAGSFLVGLFAVGIVRREAAPWINGLLVTGFCGGFTTFSAFSLETVLLVLASDWTGAALYLCGSLVLWLAAVWLGWRVGNALFPYIKS